MNIVYKLQLLAVYLYLNMGVIQEISKCALHLININSYIIENLSTHTLKI